jgi:hypothetical protein
VPTDGSSHTAGTLIGSANGSTNVSGETGGMAWGPVTTMIDGSDLKAASPGDGDKIVKVFVRRGSSWSD